jgi:predicted ATPase
LREEVDKPIDETLTRHLAGRRLLLVLDNCEHVLATCAALVERLLVAASGLRALVTSREGLGIAGERVVPVRSLASPPVGSAQDVMATFEAVRLFVDRARHVAPNFALNPSNAAAVAEICRRLDGIPLALELAAARVKLLSAEQIRAKLDDRFRLLTGNARAMSRHQTLLATLQWSYEHLGPDEQQLLRQLSVFAGGWTLSGATAVAGYASDELAVLERLERLVDKSLVLVDRDARDESRYRMLETVRQYAQDRLNEAGEGEATRNRHLELYVALAEEAEPELVGREQGAWVARLDPERENLLAAHAWCDHADGGGEQGLRLASSLCVYFRDRGLLALGHRLTVDALTRPGPQGRNLARCRALCAAGGLSNLTGRFGEAKDYLETGLAIAREIADEGSIAEALQLLGYAALGLENRALAREHFLAALAKSRRLADKHPLARSLTGLAELHRAEGELDKAEPLYEETLALHRELGDHRGVAAGLTNLARASIGLGLGDRAREMVREALAIAEDTGSKGIGAWSLDCSIGLAAFFSEWECAARLHGAIEALLEQTGYRREPVDAAFLAPLIGRTREALGAATFAAAESAGRSLSYGEAIVEARAWLEQRS